MQTLEAIFTRRSIRSFTAESIPDEVLQTIIRAAAAAPSASNAQPWVFITVQNARRLAALRSLAPGIIGVPAAVVIMCLDQRLRRESSDDSFDSITLIDLGAALQNILLTAHDLGFGGCPIGSFHKQGVMAFLNLPEHIEPCLLVALGKPRVIPPAPKKRPIEEIHFHEKYTG